MVLLPTTSAERATRERQLLDRLIGLYGEQQRLYGEVLDLSRRQRELVHDGAPLPRIRSLLDAKRTRLATINRLEATEETSKQQWRLGRREWSAESRATLHRALESVGQIIEEILACEEENDRELLQQCR
jgi:hypothetical protein